MQRFFLIAFAVSTALFSAADWRQFRGRYGNSVAEGPAPPSSWTADENTAWQAELPGRGVSSPIVVGQRVLVTCSSGVKQDRLHVLCFDAGSGKRLWWRQFWATGRTLTHPFSAVAAPTPASDGERVFAFFSSNDLMCLDLDGNLLWYRGLAFDFPKAGNDVGMSSSPVVAGETVVVQIENQGDSFAAGLNVATGETRWRVERQHQANWSSPIALPGDRDGHPVVLLQSGRGLHAHDAVTGDALWQHELPCSTTPSPAARGDRLYVPANGLTALDLPSPASPPLLAWDSNQLSPNPASPIVAEDRVYTLNSAGVLSCGDTSNGRRLWQVRIGGRHWGTPVLVGDRMYCINVDGTAKVVQLGDRGRVIGTSQFDDEIKASPAVADGALYVRSDNHLWKIAQ